MTDFDDEIGFWLRGIPYVWVNGRTIDQCKRFYIVPPRTPVITFDKGNEGETLTEVKSEIFGRGQHESVSLLPMPEGCQLPRNCFLIWLGQTILAKTVRLEGQSVGFTEYIDLP